MCSLFCMKCTETRRIKGFSEKQIETYLGIWQCVSRKHVLYAVKGSETRKDVAASALQQD